MNTYFKMIAVLFSLSTAVVAWADAKRDCGPVPPGSAFDSNCKLQAVLPPGSGLASDTQVFFDLHQAVGFLESYKSERCPTAKGRADQHLKTLATASAHIATQELQTFIKRLQAIRANIEKQSMQSLEQLRSDLHVIAQNRGWKHEVQWHQDFRKCEPIQ